MDLKDFKSIADQLRKPQGDQGAEVGKMMNKGNRLMNLAAIEQLNVEPTDNILEIGMGNGVFVRNILEKNSSVRYTGCDFSETMIREAIINNRDFIKSGQAQFKKANVNRIPFKNASFNKVLTVNTIYFWENTGNVLAEIRRVLIKNGLLVICLRPKSVLSNLPVAQFGFKTFSKQNCIDLLAAGGFHEITAEEKDDDEIELSGQKYKNAYLLVKAAKTR
jgi:ubiquinone/menaquinone biosynthesis C-methylase UbiE